MRKLITWGTPKEYQKGWESESTSNPAKLPKPKSKYCKKLKGPHNMQLVKEELHKWWPLSQGKGSLWREFRCTACNRKEIEFKTVNLEG